MATVPPQAITQTPSLLEFEGTVEVRMPDGSAAYRIDSADAFIMAVRSQIEAVVSPAGKLRHFRILPAALTAAIKAETALDAEDPDTGTSTAFATTNQGAFREKLREVAVDQDGAGFRRVTGEGGIISFCYTHCSLRGLRFKKERRQAA